jgi:hypothetical protein
MLLWRIEFTIMKEYNDNKRRKYKISEKKWCEFIQKNRIYYYESIKYYSTIYNNYY